MAPFNQLVDGINVVRGDDENGDYQGVGLTGSKKKRKRSRKTTMIDVNYVNKMLALAEIFGFDQGQIAMTKQMLQGAVKSDGSLGLPDEADSVKNVGVDLGRGV